MMTIQSWVLPVLIGLAGLVFTGLAFVYGRRDGRDKKIKEEVTANSSIETKLGIVLYKVEGIDTLLAEIKLRLGSGDTRMLDLERRLICVEQILKIKREE